jgi:hypothetical protein
VHRGVQALWSLNFGVLNENLGWGRYKFMLKTQAALKLTVQDCFTGHTPSTPPGLARSDDPDAGKRGEKWRHQDMYTEIRSETHHSVNTDDNTTPAILAMRSKATKATRSACRDSNHLPQANTRAPPRQPRPLVALSPHLIMDVGRLSSIIATNMPGELLGTRVRQQRRYQLLSIKNCPSKVVSNAPRSG